MKTESKPTSSARQEKPSNLPGANCSADALYPSLINTVSWLAPVGADAVVLVAEIYRLAGNQQPAKARKRTMHLGIALPFGDIGGDGPIVREFAQLAEAEGYEGLTLADHVLGGNPANPGSGRAGGLGLFHDPFVAFGFMAACTKKVELSTQVLILAQRQTVLVAKQAASLDVLSGGRFRFCIGVGWNEMEVVGLNENFHKSGKRSEEQFQVMQAQWANPCTTFQWHVDHIPFA